MADQKKYSYKGDVSYREKNNVSYRGATQASAKFWWLVIVSLAEDNINETLYTIFLVRDSLYGDWPHAAVPHDDVSTWVHTV